MNFPKWAILSGGAILVAVVSFFLFWSHPGKAEVESLAQELFRNAKAGKVEMCLAHVDPDYDYNGKDYEKLEKIARTYIDREEARQYELGDLEVELISGEEGRAHYTILLPVMERKIPQPLILHFLKKEGKWLVTGYEVPRKRW